MGIFKVSKGFFVYIYYFHTTNIRQFFIPYKCFNTFNTNIKSVNKFAYIIENGYLCISFKRKEQIMNENEIWEKYYVELQNHCSKCPYYHVQSFEQMKEARKTTHRCKKLSSDYRDEYSRGYYQIMDLGTICPISNKQITSKNISEVMKLVNNW